MRKQIVLVVAFIVSACDRSPSVSPPDKIVATPNPAAQVRIAPLGTEAVSVLTTACLGTCPAFKLTATPKAVIFYGYNYTAVFGQRRLTLSPRDFGALKKMLAPARAIATGRAAYVAGECLRGEDDRPVIEIIWQDRDGSRHGYFPGCREQGIDQKASLSAVLAAQRAAWSTMRWSPIAHLVGTPNRNAQSPTDVDS